MERLALSIFQEKTLGIGRLAFFNPGDDQKATFNVQKKTKSFSFDMWFPLFPFQSVDVTKLSTPVTQQDDWIKVR